VTPEKAVLTAEEMRHLVFRLELAKRIIAARFRNDPKEGERYSAELFDRALGALDYEARLCERAGVMGMYEGDTAGC